MSVELRVLLVEPWMGGSHRSWAEGFASASRHDVSIVSLPPTAWRWRLRAGAGPLAEAIADDVRANGRPDVVLVSGLVDVAQLLGLARRSLGSVPVAVFQHESQLLYPTTSGQVDGEATLRNWQSWLAADLVVFNSDFHRRAVTNALPRHLEQMPQPDQMPLLDAVLARFETMPVGLDLAWLTSVPSAREPDHPDGPTVLWPHRWEPDKAPEVFLRALRSLRSSDRRVRVVLAGDLGEGASPARDAIGDEFADWLIALGPFERTTYRRLLRRADIVVSCAEHEFFGVGVAEAIAAGAHPVLPDRLAYPELVEPQWHDSTLYPPQTFGTALASAVDEIATVGGAAAGGSEPGLAESMLRFGWPTIGRLLDDRLARLAHELAASDHAAMP